MWFLQNNDNSEKSRRTGLFYSRGGTEGHETCLCLVNTVHLLRCSSGFLDATLSEVFGDRKADEEEGCLQQPLASAFGENWLHSFIH